MVKLPEEEDTPEKRVNRIFSQMDTVIHRRLSSYDDNTFYYFCTEIYPLISLLAELPGL